jgi:hypothetical protein
MSTVRATLAGESRTTIAMNAAGFVLATALVYGVAFVGMFLVFPWHAGWLALAWTVLMLVIGLVYRLKRYHDEWATFATPWEVASIHAHVAQREVLKVTGSAHVLSEIILASSACLLRVIDCAKRQALLRILPEPRLAALVTTLARSARAGQRFIPASGLDLEALRILVANGVVWTKRERDEVLYGLDRRFDDQG